jgi:hypothetical protein
MSRYYRNELVPREDKITTMKPHHYCQSTDLNEMETDFMKSELYQLLHKSKFMRRMNRPSPVDGDLDGTYCTRYNNAVRANGITVNKKLFGLDNWYSEVENHLRQEQIHPLEGMESLLIEEEKTRDDVRYSRGSLSKEQPNEDVSTELLPFSPWIRQYIAFHKSSIINGRLKHDARYIIYECKDGAVQCGGAGDRLIGMIKVIYLALCTQRVLLIDLHQRVCCFIVCRFIGSKLDIRDLE